MSIGESKRASIIARDDSTCYLCHRVLDYDEITIDHVKPKSRGGTNARDNLKVACFRCNGIKGERLVSECKPEEFLTDESPIKLADELERKDKLKRANDRLYLARIALNPNTPQELIERLIATARKPKK